MREVCGEVLDQSGSMQLAAPFQFGSLQVLGYLQANGEKCLGHSKDFIFELVGAIPPWSFTDWLHPETFLQVSGSFEDQTTSGLVLCAKNKAENLTTSSLQCQGRGAYLWGAMA